MEKLKLLLAMFALTMLLAAAVILGSPYAPVVAPPAAIEEIWAIEDTHRESEDPFRLLNMCRCNMDLPQPQEETKA